MGDASRWFVDNGVVQGFLPAKVLQPQQMPQIVVSYGTANTNKSSNTSVPDLICMDSPEKELNVSPSHLEELLDLKINENVKKDAHNYGNVEQIPRVQQYQNLNYEVNSNILLKLVFAMIHSCKSYFFV